MNRSDQPIPSDHEIVSSRVVNFPQAVVFQAWTDPRHLAKWWGPRGFTNTFEEFDLRPGGVWQFVMHGPDGKNYKNKSVFVEIAEPERLVFDHVSAPVFRIVATFTARGPQTLVKFRMIFRTAEECARVKVYAGDANEQNFDRLEAELGQMQSNR